MDRKTSVGKITDILIEQLRTIRKRGYALADSGIQSWLKAIAAPAFDHNEKILASLAIVSPEYILNNARQDTLGEILIESASKIFHVLGYQINNRKP
jgi:DNA-binding IclR family transcriptional regulator